MDPLSAIGTFGAVANIVQGINSAISSLHELHSQWKDSDFVFMNLEAQLTTLRSALDRIQQWIESEAGDPYHQLIMDLDSCLRCSYMLVQKMDTQLMSLRHDTDGKLDTASKFKLVLGHRSLEKLQKMVERQTSTLNLVLTACNWCEVPRCLIK